MATSIDYMKQLEGMGEMPDYQKTITQAYEDPVLKPLVGESQKLEAQWLPSIFKTFTDIGTGPADMSAAAKLSKIGQGLGQLGSRVTSNKSIQDFYRMQIGDLAQNQQQRYGMQYQKLQDLYNMAFQKEEADRAEAARRRAAAAAAAASRNQMNAINDLMNAGGQEELGGEEEINVPDPTTLAELNLQRETKGRPPLPQSYWDETYYPNMVREREGGRYKPSFWEGLKGLGKRLYGSPGEAALNIGVPGYGLYNLGREGYKSIR